MKISEVAIEELIPHQEPMILLDQAIATSDDSVTCQLTITEANPFYQPEGVPNWIGIEFMAQAIAVYRGWQLYQQRQTPQLGFLLGSRKYTAHCEYFLPGQVLHISASLIYLEETLGSFDCNIHTEDGQLLATGRINTFMPEKSKIEEYLSGK
ncbi:ApeP family dehydratase [Dongshaea marina]|uniref:ApeP family dehydratase n=1 Tax=Dongshaea marina TaxID=2047966 RepID=UPI000D3E3A5F|nr:hotdog family protein [Dongshaea marina]